MKKRWCLILLCVIWMFVIFQFSASQGSESSGLSDKLASLLCRLIPFIPLNDTTTMVIRKLAHVSEYAILGFLYYQVLTTYPCSKKTMVITSIVLVILYASTDEVHQLFVSGRSGQYKDVVIDSFGGCLGIFFSERVDQLKNNRRRKA